jgi:HPt (histidine-containing phosphotransfer) domain-containing protein
MGYLADNSDRTENIDNGGLNDFNKEKSYDISQILVMSRGDDGFVRSLVKMFIVQTPLYINNIVNKFEGGDYKGMGEIAHQLKQSVYAMRIHNLKKPVMLLVNAGKKNEFDDSLAPQIDVIKQNADQVIKELKADFKF